MIRALIINWWGLVIHIYGKKRRLGTGFCSSRSYNITIILKGSFISFWLMSISFLLRIWGIIACNKKELFLYFYYFWMHIEFILVNCGDDKIPLDFLISSGHRNVMFLFNFNIFLSLSHSKSTVICFCLEGFILIKMEFLLMCL